MIKIEPAGIYAILIHFSKEPGAETSLYLSALADKIRKQFAHWIVDIVPAWDTILVYYNNLQVSYQRLKKELESAITFHQEDIGHTQQQVKTHRLPVWYQGSDLDAVAEYCHLSRNQVIDLHSQTIYFVGAIGFVPGFIYLGNLPEQLAMPRRASPRVQVAKGSVAIAEQQTTVYPEISPGGWNLIGLCPQTLFDIRLNPPMQFSIGDRVEFYVISEKQYQKLTRE